MDNIFPTSFRVEVALAFILASLELLRGTFILGRSKSKFLEEPTSSTYLLLVIKNNPRHEPK